jgi:hypothetical protein
MGDLDLGRIEPTDSDVIVETEIRERERRARQRDEEEVRVAEDRANPDMRRHFAGLP